MKRHPGIWTLIAATTLAWSVGASTWDRSLGVSELLTLRSNRPGVLGTALIVSQWPRQSALRRILLQTPEGGHLILTKVQHPTQGISILSLRDDPSGWAMTLTERSELKFKDVEETLDPGRLAARWKEDRYRVDWTLVAPGMPAVQWSSTTGDASPHSPLAEQVRAQGVGAKVRQGMPASLDEELELFQALLGSGGCSGSFLEFQPLGAVLKALGSDVPVPVRGYATLEWEPVTAMRQRGVVLKSGSAHVFVTGFLSLDPTRPLTGLLQSPAN